MNVTFISLPTVATTPGMWQRLLHYLLYTHTQKASLLLLALTFPARCHHSIRLFLVYLLVHNMLFFSRPRLSQGLLYKHIRHWIDSLRHSSLVKISLWRCSGQMVGDGVFSKRNSMYYNLWKYSKSWRAFNSNCQFESFGNFDERVYFAYCWSFSGGGPEIEGATPSSLKYLHTKIS